MREEAHVKASRPFTSTFRVTVYGYQYGERLDLGGPFPTLDEARTFAREQLQKPQAESAWVRQVWA